MSAVIELRSVKKIYQAGGEETVALAGVNLTVQKGEFIAIMGPSGSGKSTMMHIMGLLDMPTSGTYMLDGTDVSRLGKRRQAEIRNRQIGFVFQQFNLLPRTTVLDNLLLPTIYGAIEKPVERAKELIDLVGLTSKIKNKSNELSGGQVQRVAIARALVMNPMIIMADEPTGNLDTQTAHEILALLRRINESGATIVLITHESELADYADRVISIRDGQIVAQHTTGGDHHAKAAH